MGYLIETYGPNLFGQLYSTEDYYGIYGRSLPELEKEWREQLASQDDLEVLNPTELTALHKYKIPAAYVRGGILEVGEYKKELKREKKRGKSLEMLSNLKILIPMSLPPKISLSINAANWKKRVY